MGLIITARRTLALSAVLLAACSSKPVEVKPELTFPSPLVEPVPLNLTVYYPEAFKHYVFENLPVKAQKKKAAAEAKKQQEKNSKAAQEDESASDGSSAQNKPASKQSATPAPKPKAVAKPRQPVGQGLRMELGTVQTPLLSNVLRAQFASVQFATERQLRGADLLLEPEVLQFQYSSPKLTKLKVYEVWIKYRFNFFDADDAPVMQWVVPVYGKTPTAFLKSDAEAFEAATEVALRDLGAAFVTGLQRQPGFQQWLQSRRAAQGAVTADESGEESAPHDNTPGSAVEQEAQ